MKLRVLDLFSGIGGMSLGLEATGGFETVGFCEIEPYPRAVLAKHWPDVPIYDDVRTLQHDGPIDVICGGYPCQPFSVAGERRGAEDDRHLWPSMFTLVKKHRPAWVLGENVAGHISMGLDEVLSDLEAEGYDARAFVIPACAVDAPHRRDRVWIVGHAECGRQSRDNRRRSEPQLEDGCADVAYSKGVFPNPRSDGWEQSTNGEFGEADRERSPKREQERGMGRPYPTQAAGRTAPHPDDAGLQGRLYNERSNAEGRQKQSNGRSAERGYWGDRDGACVWLPEPNVGRVANGVPNRIHRLKALGNAVVPQVVEMIGRAMLNAHYNPHYGEEA